jgi:hypothetical protein
MSRAVAKTLVLASLGLALVGCGYGIGAVGGAVTSGNDINLGRPVWR